MEGHATIAEIIREVSEGSVLAWEVRKRHFWVFLGHTGGGWRWIKQRGSFCPKWYQDKVHDTIYGSKHTQSAPITPYILNFRLLFYTLGGDWTYDGVCDVWV